MSGAKSDTGKVGCPWRRGVTVMMEVRSFSFRIKKQNATFLFFRFALFGGPSRLWDELRKKVVVGDIEIAIEFQLPSGGQSPVVHTFLSGILATIGAPPSRRLRK
jgi:hypothetical protein